MTLRLVLMVGAAATVAGCANERTGGHFTQGAMHVGAAHAAGHKPPASQAEQDADLRRAAKTGIARGRATTVRNGVRAQCGLDGH